MALSGFSSLFSISSTNHAPRHLHMLTTTSTCPLSLSIGTGGEEGQVASSNQETTAPCPDDEQQEVGPAVQGRKRAYVQELEKEVRRLVDDNLKLKRQCKQVCPMYLSSSSSCSC
jgi:hypothetical protein